jgi:hypothetical protein
LYTFIWLILVFRGTYCLHLQADSLAQADAEVTVHNEMQQQQTHGVSEESLKRESEVINFLQKFANQYLRNSQHPMSMVEKNLNNVCTLSLPLAAYGWLYIGHCVSEMRVRVSVKRLSEYPVYLNHKCRQSFQPLRETKLRNPDD